MRKYTDEILSKIASEDDNTRLIIADLGNFHIFQKKHKEKHINVGVSESNSIGIAAGLASEGKRVFIYGVSGFLLYRSFEQIKFSIAYWKQPVTILGSGFGWKYFFIGRGHFTPDDIALMRLMPYMEIYTPCRLKELNEILTRKTDIPRYIRMCSDVLTDETPISDIDHRYIICSYGQMAKQCLTAVNTLQEKEVDIGYVFFNRIDNTDITRQNEFCENNLKNKTIIIVEDHCKIGGLQVLFTKKEISLHICLPVNAEAVAESEEALVKHYGLDASSIAEKILTYFIGS
jgi:transketolase C-terminal domain/subunit